MILSKDNTNARKKRHCQIQDFSCRKIVNTPHNNKSKKSPERDFFWRVASSSMVFFFVFSFITNFTATGDNMWIPAEASVDMDIDMDYSKEKPIIKSQKFCCHA